jgi:glutathione S-transferase
VARSKAKLDALLSDVEARLRDGRSYLAGDGPTAADLTFASLAAPLAYPEAYARTAVPLHRLGADARAKVEEFRARPAGQFVMRMYQAR